MDQALINRIVEAALLAANQPLALAQLHALFPEDAPAPPGSVEAALEQLRDACADRGVELVEVASGFRYQDPNYAACTATSAMRSSPASDRA